jgi:hypothetical protein
MLSVCDAGGGGENCDRRDLKLGAVYIAITLSAKLYGGDPNAGRRRQSGRPHRLRCGKAVHCHRANPQFCSTDGMVKACSSLQLANSGLVGMSQWLAVAIGWA